MAWFKVAELCKKVTTIVGIWADDRHWPSTYEVKTVGKKILVKTTRADGTVISGGENIKVDWKRRLCEDHLGGCGDQVRGQH